MRLLLVFLAWVFFTAAQNRNLNWKYTGPKENHYQYKGLINCVWTNPSNLHQVMAGTPNGGLFYTKNALETTPLWLNITDNLPYMNFGVSGIVVMNSPEPKQIYISTCTGGGLIPVNFGNGILYSGNAGHSWEHVGPGKADDFNFPLSGLKANDKDQKQMIAFHKKDLYLTKDAWQTFRKLQLPLHANVDRIEIADVEFAPYEPGKIYVSTKTYNANKAQLLVSTDDGNSWQDITPADAACERIAIATIKNQKFRGKFYITVGNQDVFVRYFNGQLFSSNINEIPVKHLGASSYWCLELEVNSADTSVMYLSLTETSRSNNGGKNFVKIGAYNGMNTHADIRGMLLAVSTPGGNNDVLLLANDGGVSMNRPFGGYHHPQFRNLNGSGLHANQFWDLNVLQSDSLFITGGAQDNGGFFIKARDEKNNLHQCGDGYLSLALNDSIALIEGNPPNFIHYNYKTAQSTFITIPDPHCEARRPLILKDSSVYIGYHDVWRAGKSDVIRGKFSFENISKIPFKTDPQKGLQNREIKGMSINFKNRMLIAYANPNWDAQINEGKIYYCRDVNAAYPDFTDITAITANKDVELCRWSHVESIAADAENDNTFYVIYKDVFDQKNAEIYRLIYFPDSNKVSLSKCTYNLNRVGFNRLYIDRISNMLYVCSNDGLYYRDLGNEDSVYHHLDFFPKVAISDAEINYHTNTIYVSTFGRGIWQAQLPAFLNKKLKIKRSKTIESPWRVDGELVVGRGRNLNINSKLIVTTGSKIILKKGSSLIVTSPEMLVDENNDRIEPDKFLIKAKKSSLLFRKTN